jgi:hypothetical protein
VAHSGANQISVALHDFCASGAMVSRRAAAARDVATHLAEADRGPRRFGRSLRADHVTVIRVHHPRRDRVRRSRHPPRLASGERLVSVLHDPEDRSDLAVSEDPCRSGLGPISHMLLDELE